MSAAILGTYDYTATCNIASTWQDHRHPSADFAAVYYFFLTGWSDATDRLQRFIDQAAQASMVGNTFDDAASAQGLLNYFVSGINCGALTEAEALQTGIGLDELHGRSFLKIVENRTHG